MSTNCSIVWFRRDLRVEDNPALAAGVRAGPVIPLFIWSPEEEGHYYPGRVSKWWIKQSLVHLDSSLRSLGAPLITKRSTDSISALLQVIESTGATQLFYNHLYDPLSLVRDHKLKQDLSTRGILVRSFNADLLYEPWEVNDEEGRAFSTFEAYWNKCLNMPYDPSPPLLPPKRIIQGDVSSCPSENLGLEDESEKGSNALLARAWSPGWSSADKALTAFINGPLIEYAKNHRKADSATTSLLSPHLHFGELSVRKAFHLVRIKQVLWANEGNTSGEQSVNLFLKSIGLREYSRYLSFNFPCSHERPLLAHLNFFPWRVDKGYFKSWRQGRTGYPLVDAGMRELWATGWLHDRIRVVVSSFFVKVLQLPWRWGMKYFWDTLLDADLECDALGWQYISGSLPDGREIDRIDNPQIEGYKFDPAGEYVRRWLPELARLPTEWIHHPWDAPEFVLHAAGIELGSNYPRPIVEISAAKDRLQEALTEMWQCEAASRAALENGIEEGLGESLENNNDLLPEHMDLDREPVRNNTEIAARSQEDQMVPSMTDDLRRAEVPYLLNQDVSSVAPPERPEVPSNMNPGIASTAPSEQYLGRFTRPMTRISNEGLPYVSDNDRLIQVLDLQNESQSTAESSSTLREHDEVSGGGIVPVWSQSMSGHSQQFPEEGTVPGSNDSDNQRHLQSHPMVTWRPWSQSRQAHIHGRPPSWELENAVQSNAMV
uniref:Cryptochrome-1 n=1 Tax=Ginkgo biloba TaxID=3311 RepID=A0A385FUL9_GINBI|nr:cryptochrome-1 [Ginkgo biloba]|eukprot:Gb_13122 [translate_table: standard]